MRLEVAREQYDSLLALQPQNAASRSDLGRTLHELCALMLQLNDGDAALRYAKQAMETAAVLSTG